MFALNGRTVRLHEVEGEVELYYKSQSWNWAANIKMLKKWNSENVWKAQTWFRVGCCSTLTLSIHTCILNSKPQCYRIPNSKRQRYRIPSNSFKVEKRIKPRYALELNWLEMYSDDIWLLKWILRKASTNKQLKRITQIATHPRHLITKLLWINTSCKTLCGD